MVIVASRSTVTRGPVRAKEPLADPLIVHTVTPITNCSPAKRENADTTYPTPEILAADPPVATEVFMMGEQEYPDESMMVPASAIGRNV
jgi:hypothetical protein